MRGSFIDFLRAGSAWALLAAVAGLHAQVQTGGAAAAPNPADELVFRSWGTEAGLPQNTVNAIVQTPDGYLWLGTGDGLARFDGVRFKVFGLQDGLQSVEVQTLYVDSRGTLWIGTSGGGLGRWAGGRIENVRLPQHLTPSDTVTALTEDNSGGLWIGTLAGLTISEAGHFGRSEGLANLGRSGIRALQRDSSGGMWIATLARGLFEFRDQRLVESRGPPGNERILAYCLLEDSRSNLWASVGNGTVLFRHGGQWERFTETNGLPFAYVTCLAEDKSGTIWAGSLDDGLYCFRGGRFFAIRKQQGLSANDIRSLCVDREGHLWVGTRTGGLNRLSRRRLISCGAAQGLTNDYTRSVAETADGVLWVGTTGGGLYRGGLAGFKPFAPYYASVDSVLAAGDRSLWWGAARGLFRLRNGVTDSFTNEPWLGSAAVTALCDDKRGGVWVGTSTGRLVHYRDGRFIPVQERVARGPVTGLAEEPGGGLWVGSMAGGVVRLAPGEQGVEVFTNGLVSQAIRTLYRDRQGALWIGTAGGGLSCHRDGRVTTFTAAEGLSENTVVQLVEDDYGFLWLGTSHGVLRIRKSDLIDLADGKRVFLHPRAFGINEGMPAEECSSGFCPAGLKTKAGLVCFSTVKGLVFFDPREQDTNSLPPRVLLEEVLANGQPKVTRKATRTLRASAGGPGLTVTRRVSLGPDERQLEIHYTGIAFDSPERLRFRYFLQGVDSDWVDAGERRTAYYHNLPAGHFVFHVLACNADGIWSTTGPTLAITVKPYLWERTWFLALSGLATLGGVAGLIRLLERRRYRLRLALVETRAAIERERVRISQDMHDDLGSILTQVSQLSDLGQGETADAAAARSTFERIGNQARAAVQALDEIVWATNPKNDNLPRFAEYICRFADELFENSSVRCWQEVPTSLPPLPLAADIRHNVFLALKEAFNNVLKHSGASEVWLRLAFDHSDACVTVADNGRGFDGTTIQPGRNGLDNMQTRLGSCGGRLELNSTPGQGTTVRFVFPLPKGI